MSSLTLNSTFNYNLLSLPTTYITSKPFSNSRVSFKLKSSPFCSSQTPKLTSTSTTNDSFNINRFWVFITFLEHVKNSASSKTKTWVSKLQAYSYESERELEECESSCCLQNSAFGLALLSIKSNAKVKISPFIATLAGNPTFVSGLLAWFVAQSMKVFLNFFVERKWDFRILFASGGMPSSHSALCTALTTSVAICHGVADSLFPVCLGFSLIVMYDAIGVRRHAGMQAEVLNLIVEDLFQGHPISQRKLKELLGHTPSQVFAGAVLGILVACACCQGCLVVT